MFEQIFTLQLNDIAVERSFYHYMYISKVKLHSSELHSVNDSEEN